MAWVEGKRGRRIAFERPYKLTKCWQKKAKKAVIGFLYTFYTFIFLYKDWALAHFVSFRIMSLCRWGRRPDHGTRASPSRVTCQKPKYRPGWAQAQVRRRSKIVWRDHSTARFFVHCIAHGTAHGRKSTPRICLRPRFSKIQNCAFLKLCGSHIYPAWKHGPNRAGRSGSSGSSGSGSGQFVKFKLRRSQDTTSEVFSSIRHPRFSVCQALIGILGKWRCRRCRQHP